MTTRPRLRLGGHLLPGLIAIGIFVVFATVILRASFGEPVGFPSGDSVTAQIGYALLGIETDGSAVDNFLVAFIAIAVVLDAALSGAVMLASREDDGGEA